MVEGDTLRWQRSTQELHINLQSDQHDYHAAVTSINQNPPSTNHGLDRLAVTLFCRC